LESNLPTEVETTGLFIYFVNVVKSVSSCSFPSMTLVRFDDALMPDPKYSVQLPPLVVFSKTLRPPVPRERGIIIDDASGRTAVDETTFGPPMTRIGDRTGQMNRPKIRIEIHRLRIVIPSR
jgi:hypothetical protein